MSVARALARCEAGEEGRQLLQVGVPSVTIQFFVHLICVWFPLFHQASLSDAEKRANQQAAVVAQLRLDLAGANEQHQKLADETHSVLEEWKASFEREIARVRTQAQV